MKPSSSPSYSNHFNLFIIHVYPTHTMYSLHCRGLLLHQFTLNDKPHSVDTLWTCDRPVTENSTLQRTIYTRERHPRPCRDSNAQFQLLRGPWNSLIIMLIHIYYNKICYILHLDFRFQI
jgi:hypothetical protein